MGPFLQTIVHNIELVKFLKVYINIKIIIKSRIVCHKTTSVLWWWSTLIYGDPLWRSSMEIMLVVDIKEYYIHPSADSWTSPKQTTITWSPQWSVTHCSWFNIILERRVLLLLQFHFASLKILTCQFENIFGYFSIN